MLGWEPGNNEKIRSTEETQRKLNFKIQLSLQPEKINLAEFTAYNNTSLPHKVAKIYYLNITFKH